MHPDTPEQSAADIPPGNGACSGALAPPRSPTPTTAATLPHQKARQDPPRKAPSHPRCRKLWPDRPHDRRSTPAPQRTASRQPQDRPNGARSAPTSSASAGPRESVAPLVPARSRYDRSDAPLRTHLATGEAQQAHPPSQLPPEPAPTSRKPRPPAVGPASGHLSGQTTDTHPTKATPPTPYRHLTPTPETCPPPPQHGDRLVGQPQKAKRLTTTDKNIRDVDPVPKLTRTPLTLVKGAQHFPGSTTPPKDVSLRHQSTNLAEGVTRLNREHVRLTETRYRCHNQSSMTTRPTPSRLICFDSTTSRSSSVAHPADTPQTRRRFSLHRASPTGPINSEPSCAVEVLPSSTQQATIPNRVALQNCCGRARASSKSLFGTTAAAWGRTYSTKESRYPFGTCYRGDSSSSVS
ncbi:hypothetical protein EV138_6462 [Kribbella voronezhensis]|uniref:Uncharacterized protein n=1 Tax=Kribbella voronezhensis TaxID=2512212 RepID=A0A4R7SZL2_9ACTN|nr:hypothetical protein EV138_6462 [Kribbella voronezhensis]